MNLKGAVILGGCAESKRSLEPLADATHSLFSSVDIITYPQACRLSAAELRRRLGECAVIPHSAGNMHAKFGAMVFALCGPEPTHPAKAIPLAGRAAYSSLNRRESEHSLSTLNTAQELLMHPAYLKILTAIGRFSTSRSLIQRGDETFHGGRFYLQAHDDEFGFTRPDKMKEAAAHGVVTDYLGRFHDYPLRNPKATVAKMKELMDRKSVAA